MKAITDSLVSKHKQQTPSGSTAAKDPVTETKGWSTYKKKVPIEAKKADKGGTLRTLEGPARYRKGDFIARGAKGEKWPIRSDVFRKTYQLVGKAHGAKTAGEYREKAEAEEYVRRNFGPMSPRAAGQIGSRSRRRKGRTKTAFRIRGRWADEATAPTRALIEWFRTPEGMKALRLTGGIALLSGAGVGFMDRVQDESLLQRDLAISE